MDFSFPLATPKNWFRVKPKLQFLKIVGELKSWKKLIVDQTKYLFHLNCVFNIFELFKKMKEILNQKVIWIKKIHKII